MTSQSCSRVDAAAAEEAVLVDRLQSRDEAAFREVVQRYQGKVLSIVYSILRNRNDAEDVAQLVFTAVYLSVRNYDRRGSLMAWIHRITVNECLSSLRRKKTQRVSYESDYSAEDFERMANSRAAADHDPRVDGQLAQHDLLVRLLATISERDRGLILLKEVEGHSVNDIVALTGLPETTIKVRLFRARQKLLKAARALGVAESRPSRWARPAYKPAMAH